MSKIDQIMAEVEAHLKDGVLQVKEWKEEGKPVVGTYCTFAPWEIITAAGAIPATLCARGEEPIAAAEEHLPRNLCPLIKSSYGYALTDKCPYFHFCDMVIAESTCDGKKKMYELMERLKPLHLMMLPQTAQGKAARDTWRAEVERLRSRLEKSFSVKITDQDISRQIELRNRERVALRSMWELSKMDPPAITGKEQYMISEYCEFHFHKEELVPWLEKVVSDIKEAYDQGERRVDGKAPRILITGCPLGGAQKVIHAVEDSGGVIVCYENCGGVKEQGFLVDEDRPPMEALTDKYLNIGCSVMTPNKSRMENLRALMEEYKVDGVVEVVLQACHTYAVETYEVRELVRSTGRPYLSIETDYSKSDVGQISTRISAFLEMI
ncbi:double-cubane-cluster-containing anaerobic reductase [Dethiosulfovibrio salsuginis]|uniref:Benzoyl-CoA reductase/2-hydroxyglutaryl-CoA dehydratase subunit, BcrC/BadD/HgdB n=1 Tax=Dethiosulfovibrio salsuginis TaxID=561720 RepID=A0A1X7IHN3_9BACT|nr:double-cubane-cluster-containing anaerobic reductase [Dethiosulfovibrio salsuginis]SMG13934.1 Benzoyl-CoA reductase/2-hydroxyglutaryl-CoA dehydratase subunit, BcrC/BadD/HgdB [Dethiosulfovibrio salsuginis]